MDKLNIENKTSQLNLMEQVKKEELSRSERLEILSHIVDELFKGEGLESLKEDIINRSFNVPQWGPYHNEGLFMDTHLMGIVDNIEAGSYNKFREEVHEEIKEWMYEVINKNKESLMYYAFLHDISKADCLTIKFKNKDNEEIEWLNWVQRLPNGIMASPLELKIYCEENEISGISYFHKSSSKKHGEEGAALLEELKDALNLPDALFTAIAKHEVAFQFNSVKIKTFKKHFSEFSKEELKWVITASYLDTVSSLRENGEPDLSNFLAMVNTVHNYNLIEKLNLYFTEEFIKENGIDNKKLNKFMQGLEKSSKRISESEEDIIEKVKDECSFTIYSYEKLNEFLSSLISLSQITEEQKVALLECFDIETHRMDEQKLSGVRKKLGKANKIVSEVLKDCEV